MTASQLLLVQTIRAEEREHPARTTSSPAPRLTLSQPIGCRQGKDINIALFTGPLKHHLS